MNSRAFLLAGMLVALAVLGVVLMLRDDREGTIDAGSGSASGGSGDDGRSREELLAENRALAGELEAAKERIRALETTRDSGKDAGGGKKEATDIEAMKAAWAEAEKREGQEEKKGKGDKAWSGKKETRIGLPEGMTREEQDARVREIVEAHDWEASADALHAWEESNEGGRGVSIEEKEALGSFFETIGALAGIGVEFFDLRVSRRFAPARISSLGADLDERQAERVASFVDEVSRREANEPEPDPPLRYAHAKARELSLTLDLERHLESTLRPEQFLAYLESVGDDPFASGFGFKTDRLSCAGETPSALAEQTADLWSRVHGLEEVHRSLVLDAAHGLVSQALSVPPAPDGGDVAPRRRAILERRIRLLELQGDAEQALLLAFPLGEDGRARAFAAQCPVIDLVLER